MYLTRSEYIYNTYVITLLCLQINTHITTLLHQYLNLRVSDHTSEHKTTNFEDCYNFKGSCNHIKHQNPKNIDENKKK